ncbi:CLUMA_CG003530, isoform A [Clunio marinus]|uniref:CLUMA_CG003530, isoform A n=1 Tax=Clunio marinus TaxID=568069 RepID=A0A1J1HUD0_9DIPT|nr:CLUMA_CG003530, isoform A [Clunio marinus]
MSKVLQELNDEELQYIINKLERHLPRLIKDLYFILTAQRLRSSSADNFPIFYKYSEGLMENCTIFGITKEGDHKVWLFTLQDSLQELTECLEKTKLINWDKVSFVTVHRAMTLPIFEHIKKNNLKLLDDEQGSYYWMMKENALNLNIEIPNGTYVKRLSDADSHFCNNIWNFRKENSEPFVRSLINVNGGYGLFDETSNELLCFALINDHSAVGLLTTIERFRGKKYGQLIAKYVSLKISETLNLHPTVYINDVNPISRRIFERIGFQKIGDMNWIEVRKNLNK